MAFLRADCFGFSSLSSFQAVEFSVLKLGHAAKISLALRLFHFIAPVRCFAELLNVVYHALSLSH
jgi:hypothetical protein